MEETSHTRINLHNRLLDNQHELKVQIHQLIKNYCKDSVGPLSQINDLWQQFWHLDEEVQKAALPTGSEYASQLVALKELIENINKYLWTICRREARSEGFPGELRPTSRLQQVIKSREAQRLTWLSDRCREDATNWNHHHFGRQYT